MSHQPRWALWWVVTAGTRSMAEVPQKMLSGARACTMPSAACHPSSPAFSGIFPCHTGQGFLPHYAKPESTIILDQAYIQQTLLTTSNPLFLTHDPLFTLLPNLHHYNVNSKPHSECWENSCFAQLGQAKYKSGCLYGAQLIFLIKNANGMQV